MPRFSAPLRRILAFLLLAAAGLVWLPESDLPRDIAKQHPIFLGRYSETQFWAILIGSILLAVAAVRIAVPSRVPARLRWKRRLLAAVASLVVLGATEVVWRELRQPRYRLTQVESLQGWPGDLLAGVVRSRPPGRRYDVRFDDRPSIGHHFVSEPPGHPPVRVRLTVDDNGFRNLAVPDRADIVVLGDSFAEGSYVDDRETWPMRIAARTGRSIYTLAVSGAAPPDYLAAARELAFRFHPRTVICLLYEGNDFDASAGGGGGRRRRPTLRQLAKSSPIRFVLKTTAMRWFGGVPVRHTLPGAESVSWIPLTVPEGLSGKAYAFECSDLVDYCVTRESFRASPGWRGAAEVLEALRDLCREHQARLVVAYAPAKPRVVLSLASERVPARRLRGFVSYAVKGLPPAGAFREQFFAHLDDLEAVARAFCRDRGIAFVSTTAALQDAAGRGVQVYYTYDQHWTAEGHAIVADRIAGSLAAASDR